MPNIPRTSIIIVGKFINIPLKNSIKANPKSESNNEFKKNVFCFRERNIPINLYIISMNVFPKPQPNDSFIQLFVSIKGIM